MISCRFAPILTKSTVVLLAGLFLAPVASSGAWAQSKMKPKPIRTGGVLSGELTAMKSGPKKKRVITYQLTSEPRQLPPPSGLCNLETGPETFQIVTNSDAEITALKPFIGKKVAVKAEELSCAQAAGQFSDAIVTKWSVLTKH